MTTRRTKDKVAVYGTGNVATHLACAFAKAQDVDFIGIIGRDTSKVQTLATQIGTHALTLKDVDESVTVIVAVADDAVAQVARQLADTGATVAHTSGSVNLTALTDTGILRAGVFYPLQTFTADRQIDMHSIPFFIEGTDAAITGKLKDMAHAISNQVYEADSHRRATLHLAAVFACNFANQLWAEAQTILAQGGYPLSVLEPLLHETLAKAMQIGPVQAQTGPAVRGDHGVMHRQLTMLGADTDPGKLYQLMSEMIINTHKNEL